MKQIPEKSIAQSQQRKRILEQTKNQDKVPGAEGSYTPNELRAPPLNKVKNLITERGVSRTTLSQSSYRTAG